MVKQLLLTIGFIPTLLAAQDMARLETEALAYLNENTGTVISAKAYAPASINSRIEQGRSEADLMLIVTCSQPSPMIMQVLDETGRPTTVFRQLNLLEGEQEIPVNLTGLKPGNYLISLQAPNQRSAVVHKVYKP
jgi:hypothetical protein